MVQKKGGKFKLKIPFFFQLLVGSLFGVFLLLSPSSAKAASLFFSPNSGSYTIGQNFSVGVYVSSRDEAANAFQGTIDFPADKLQLTSLSKGGSIVSLWIKEPSFSSGKVQFEGITFNPGFTGGNGKVLTLNFKVKAAGKASLGFAGGSVLANDGKGTNILSGSGSASYTLKIVGDTEGESLTPATEKTAIPLAPQIKSDTHPDQKSWYSNNNPSFSWNLPGDVTGVSVGISKNESGNPGTISDGLFDHRSYIVEDGEWYFHLRFRNRFGWGPTSHYGFKIDSEVPAQFDIKYASERIGSPEPALLFNTSDSLSGIEKYKLIVDEHVVAEVRSDLVAADKPYVMLAQQAGDHALLVEAYDKAGNFSTSSINFSVEELKAPSFTDYQERLQEGEILMLKGKTYPDSEVTMFVRHDDGMVEEKKIQSNQSGEFYFVYDLKVRPGLYKVWAEARDIRGVKTASSQIISIPVKKQFFINWGERSIILLVIATQFFALLALIVVIVDYTRRRFKLFKNRLLGDIERTEKNIFDSIAKLRNNAAKQIKVLKATMKKRELTVEEAKIFDQLNKDLASLEEIIKSKLDGLEKKVK